MEVLALLALFAAVVAGVYAWIQYRASTRPPEFPADEIKPGSKPGK